MYILAADTSTEFASVALIEDGAIISSMSDSGKQAHNQKLFDMMSELLNKAGITVRGIDIFAIGSGPGSFTGLRVGVSAFKGMAIGSGKKIVAVSSMDAAALKVFADFRDEKRIEILLEGRQKDFFSAAFSYDGHDVRKINEIIVRPYGDIDYINGLAAGNVEKEFADHKDYRQGYGPDAVFTGMLAYIRRDSASFNYDFEPEYYKEFKVR